MTLTDIGEMARQLSSIISTLVIVAGGVWYLVRKARGYFDAQAARQETQDRKQDAMLEAQIGTNDHLATLNGSVARHEQEIGRMREHIAGLEGAVFKRGPLPEEQ